ncbi:MAG: hypothetical protein EZS28_023378 [Streblomastix strix]|uniref:ISXO2-like transposase domain-containing protein n=1 Tax=Streblomastix strix TaxID=222440 RepID=A0A5J4VEW3_9EUKA|nr:MAG: hypothetical protein EZS28_023378 [Streblomastix strix]
MADNLSNNAEQIGGQGVTIKCDEAPFGRRKYNKGRQRLQTWVLGGIERDMRENQPRRMFLEPVANRNSETLCEIIQRRVLPGTIIITDMWRAYSNLDRNGAHFRHLTVNHSVNFVDPNTEANTQI